MRPSKVACLVMAALNAALFTANFFSVGTDRLEARVSLSAGGAKAAIARGAPVPFRIEGERPQPAAAPIATLVAVPPPEAPSESAIDSGSITYLGSMTLPNGSADYFFKNRVTNRVYSAGKKDGGIKVLETSEKEFLIEIDGTKYKVER